MTNFHPNFREIHPAHAPPRLAEGVVAALTRWMNPKLSWGPVKTLVLGLLSGGLLPLIILQKRFRAFVIAERTHLWHFAEWMRLEFPGRETESLQTAVANLRFRVSLCIGSLILMVIAVCWAWSEVSYAHLPSITPKFLFTFTAQLPNLVRDVTATTRLLFAAAGFAMLLVAAHLMWLWQIFAHASDMQRIASLYNVAAKKHGLDPVTLPSLLREFRLIWLVTAGVAGFLGALWGVPMVLAACAQAGYINGTGRRLRLALSRAFLTHWHRGVRCWKSHYPGFYAAAVCDNRVPCCCHRARASARAAASGRWYEFSERRWSVSVFYGILCVVGWTWTVLLAAIFEREIVRGTKTQRALTPRAT